MAANCSPVLAWIPVPVGVPVGASSCCQAPSRPMPAGSPLIGTLEELDDLSPLPPCALDFLTPPATTVGGSSPTASQRSSPRDSAAAEEEAEGAWRSCAALPEGAAIEKHRLREKNTFLELCEDEEEEEYGVRVRAISDFTGLEAFRAYGVEEISAADLQMQRKTLEGAGSTVLVISNLPQGLTQEVLIEVLDREEFSGLYDFVYMPVDLKTELNYGRALVSVVAHEQGLLLKSRLRGRRTWGLDHAGPCEVAWSTEFEGLGIADIVEKHRTVPENGKDVPEELRPQLFSRGWPVRFPRQG